MTNPQPVPVADKASKHRMLVIIGVVVLLILLVVDAYAQFGYKWASVTTAEVAGEATEATAVKEKPKPLYKFEALFGYGACVVMAWIALVFAFIIKQRPDFYAESRDQEGAG